MNYRKRKKKKNTEGHWHKNGPECITRFVLYFDGLLGWKVMITIILIVWWKGET